MDWFLYDNDLRHERVKSKLCPMVDIAQYDLTLRPMEKNCIL